MRIDQFPKPFWRAARSSWFVQVAGKQVKLSGDKDEAFRLYHELMARPPEQRVVKQPAPSDLLAVEVLDRFLDWCQKNRSKSTYVSQLYYSKKLTPTLPAYLPVAELKPYHLTRVMDAQEGWSTNTKHNFVTAISRAFNWAVDEGLIDRSPIFRMKKPAREARELTASPTDFSEIISVVKEPHLRDLIELAWETGARVQELRKIEARYYEPAANRIVFPPSQAKGKKHHRVIYLGSERAAEIVKRLCEENENGPILLNSEGRPWNKDSINCAFCRIEKKIGRKLHLGAMRKGFCTEALKAGVDTQTLSHLMGHANGAMISRVYSRVQADPVHMLDAARRAKAVKDDGA